MVAGRVDAGFQPLLERLTGASGMIPAMNRREKRAGRRSRRQRERALLEVEDRQFTLRRFVDRAVFVWMPIVIAIVAIVVVIIWQTQ